MRRLVIIAALAVSVAPVGRAEAQWPPPEGAPCNVTVTTGDFDPGAHELGFFEDGKILVTIDGRPYSGTDGTVPRTEVRSIAVAVGGREHRASAEAIRGLYEPHSYGRDCTAGCRYACDPFTPALVLTGGDGAGSYLAIFVFEPRSDYVTRLLVEHPDEENAKVRRFDLRADG